MADQKVRMAIIGAGAVADYHHVPGIKLDPRAELVNKLLEYQRFKDAAGILSVYNEKAKDIYYRRTPPAFDKEDFLLRAPLVAESGPARNRPVCPANCQRREWPASVWAG